MSRQENILGTESIPKLLLKFGLPSVISMLVNTIYNLVDQIFIGRGVGMLGNGATNVTMPFVTISMAISLMISIGTAANVGLNLGRKKQETADKILGNGFFLAVLAGVIICAIGEFFLEPMLVFFGATPNILPYALDYASIFLLGIPATSVGIMISDEIRADNSPGYAMMSMLAGAILNTICDPIFIFVFHWGVKGAAVASIMGQYVTLFLNLYYMLRKMKVLTFSFANVIPRIKLVKSIITLGVSAMLTQLAMLVQQIVMNKQTVYYGELSKFGADIPITVFGIVMKVNGLMMALIMGLTIGTQPIFSYNYGAKLYGRVKELVKTCLAITITIGLIGTACFQLFPSQIISIFGQEDPLYNEFAVTALKNMTFFIFIMSVQMVATTFFQSTGKPMKATILSLSRQFLFSIPCLFILPLLISHFSGIENAILGVMFTFPVSDVFAVALGGYMLAHEMKLLTKAIKEEA